MMIAGGERKADANERRTIGGELRERCRAASRFWRRRTGRAREKEREREESALRRRRGKDLKKTVKATGVRDGKGCGLGASQPSIAPGQPLDGGQ